MSVRRLCALVVPALLAGALAAPALGTQLAPPVPPVAALPAAVVSAGPAGVVSHRDAAAALTAVRDHSDIGAWLGSVAAATRAAAGPGASLQPLLLSPPVEPEPAEPGETAPQAWAFAVPGGDLDGDGRADVLTYSSQESAFTLEARRGVDGAALWTMPLDLDAGIAFPLDRDVTGDGRDDLVLLQYAFDVTLDEETDDGWRFLATTSLTYGVASGADGAAVWTRQVDGEIAESATWQSQAAGTLYDFEYRLRSTNLAAVVLASLDVSGDALDDVVVSEVDLDVDARASGVEAGVAYAEDFAVSLRSGTRGLLVEGTTGSVQTSRESSGQPGVSLLLPVGHVVGSPAGDLIWTTERYADVHAVCAAAVLVGRCVELAGGEAATDLELLDGQSGATAWTWTAPGAAWAYPVGADVEGDGAADLAVEVTGESGRLVMLSGRTGSVLWGVSSDGYPPFLVGTVAGTDGLVAVLAEVRFGDDGVLEQPTIEVLVERRLARTGAVLSSDRRTPRTAHVDAGTGAGGWHLAVWLGPVADGDGDGGDELLVGVVSEAWSWSDGGETTGHAAASDFRYEALDTGRELHAESSDDVRVLLPTGDLDGDGLLDLRRDVVTAVDVDEGHGDVRAASTALRLSDGRELWRLEGSLWDVPVEAGDQDGNPGVELLAVGGHDGPVVSSLRGHDLAPRWSHRVGSPASP